MVELKIGKKTFEMKLISWGEGGALLPVENAATAGTTPAQRRIIGAGPTGKVLRLFAARASNRDNK
jgi:hypothetical protein